MTPPGDRSHDISSSGVPLHIWCHVMLSNVHHGAVWSVHKSKRSIHAIEWSIRNAQVKKKNNLKIETSIQQSIYCKQTSSVQPRPKTAPGDSRRCCLPVACRTFLKTTHFGVSYYEILKFIKRNPFKMWTLTN